MAKEEKKEKVEIPKEFFDDIISTNKKIIERLERLETKPDQSVPSISPSGKGEYLFQCMETSFFDKKPETSQEVIAHQEKIMEFRKKLEVLMKEYRIGLTNAIFLKKL